MAIYAIACRMALSPVAQGQWRDAQERARQINRDYEMMDESAFAYVYDFADRWEIVKLRMYETSKGNLRWKVDKVLKTIETGNNTLNERYNYDAPEIVIEELMVQARLTGLTLIGEISTLGNTCAVCKQHVPILFPQFKGERTVANTPIGQLWDYCKEHL